MLELKRVVGLSPDNPVKLGDTLEVLARMPAAPGTPDVRERADVQEAAARVQAAQARIEQAQAEGRFDVTLFGSYMRMDAGFAQRGVGAAGDLERVHGLFHYVSAGATVMMPLWNRNQGAIAAARAEQAAAAARLEADQLKARTEIAATTAQLSHSTQALGVMADGLKLARQNLDVVRQTYELGRGALSEVLAEQRRYLEFEHEYTSALRETFEARTALEFARGELK